MKRNIHGELEHWKMRHDRKPLILKGARQVGKTYSLRAFGEESFPAFHYINFEQDNSLKQIFKKDFRTKRILDELSFYLDRSIDVKDDLLILDEIQECPDALTSLKYFHEERPELALCAAGSLLGIHLGEASFPVGKVDLMNMYPMSFEEFLQGTGDTKSFNFLHSFKAGDEIPDLVHAHLWDQLKIYFIVGGLPEIVETYGNHRDNLFEAIQLARERQQDLILAYNADMAKHSGKLNAMHIERLWRNIPAQLAREQNGSASKFRFKGVIPGIKRYDRLSGPLDWLQTAGVAIKVSIANKAQLPLSAYIKENSFKLYVFDVGILGALSGLPPKTILDYDYGTYKGYFAENFVAQEFLCSSAETLYAWAEKNSEVEFLRTVESSILPVEIKSGWITQAKSLKIYAEKYHPEYTTIMSARNLTINSRKKIHRYPLYLAFRFPLPTTG